MPVDGSFDDDEPEQQEAPKDSKEAEGFVSVLATEGNDGAASETRIVQPAHLQQVLIAVVAALLVVGGTVLFITRPWNPNAYAIHSFVDADTSMEGYPGELSHLSSQDHSKEMAHRELVLQHRKCLDAFEADMAKYMSIAEELYARLGLHIDGQVIDDDLGFSQARALAASFSSRYEEVRGLSFDDEALEERKSSLMGYARYLDGALTVLDDAWRAVATTKDRGEGIALARSALQGDASEYGYEAWHDLFVNSYGTRG